MKKMIPRSRRPGEWKREVWTCGNTWEDLCLSGWCRVTLAHVSAKVCLLQVQALLGGWVVGSSAARITALRSSVTRMRGVTLLQQYVTRQRDGMTGGVCGPRGGG